MAPRPLPMFPILGDPIIKAIPWAALAPHEAQAKSNHGGQSLNRLAHRGGLGIEEAYCVLNDRAGPRAGSKWDKPAVRRALMRLIVEFPTHEEPPAKPEEPGA